MNITYSQRQKLNELSKEVFGSSSKWKSLIEKGYTELLTDEVTVLIPNPNSDTGESTPKQVQVPRKRKDGAHQHVTKRHTLESIVQHMNDMKSKMAEFKALMEKQKEEERLKKEKEELNKRIQEDVSGSALLP